MNELLSWNGKADDVSMSYELCFPRTKLLSNGDEQISESNTYQIEGEITEEF